MANRQCEAMDRAIAMYRKGGISMRQVALRCQVSVSGLYYALKRLEGK